jgi:hypothetical protein
MDEAWLQIPQYADLKCSVLNGEINRAMGDTKRERNFVYPEGVDNEFGACNDVKESHDTVIRIATGYGLDCLAVKCRCGEKLFAPFLTELLRPTLLTRLLQGAKGMRLRSGSKQPHHLGRRLNRLYTSRPVVVRILI